MVANILEGRSQIVVLPTGSGKSLCFQLPALLQAGPTLVLVPLLSLLADQLRRLRDAGVPAGELRGGLSPGERATLLAAIRSGATRIVLATPEACLAGRTLAELARCGFAHLVVDEAHCVSEWGDRFRPTYLRLGELARGLGAPVVTAFTATASPPVIERIREVVFGEAAPAVVVGGADRPNIRYRVLPVLARMRAIEQLAASAPRPLVVFCRTREGSEVRARELARRRPGDEALFYHAGLTRPERSAVERRFFGSRVAVLFTTSAYGLGVDKPDIRTVAHADVPPSVEAYLQETGRAGRDGAAAEAVLLAGREDEAFLGRLTGEVERTRFERMLAYARSAGGCRRTTLLSLISQPPVACQGCDVCDGTAIGPGSDAAAGAAEIVAFARRYPRRFSLERAAEVLAGARSPRVSRGFLDCLDGYGALRGWETADVEEAIGGLLAEGRLRVAAWGPWRGMLATARSPRR